MRELVIYQEFWYVTEVYHTYIHACMSVNITSLLDSQIVSLLTYRHICLRICFYLQTYLYSIIWPFILHFGCTSTYISVRLISASPDVAAYLPDDIWRPLLSNLNRSHEELMKRWCRNWLQSASLIFRLSWWPLYHNNNDSINCAIILYAFFRT